MTSIAYCETKVSQRDRKADKGKDAVTGLMIDRTPNGGTSFYFRFINPATGKRDQVPLGIYHPEANSLRQARARANKLKDCIARGENISQSYRLEKAELIEKIRLGGITVDGLISEWIAFIKTPINKEHVGMQPRVKTWASLESQLHRFVSPRLGCKLARELTNVDIAKLESAIKEGEFGKPSVSNARHVRKALSSMFTWAAQPPHVFVQANPCATLPPLDKEPGRDRPVLDVEIRKLWQLLDSNELGNLSKHTRLLFKFAMATARRTSEVRALHVNELVDLDGENPHMIIPANRVKNGKPVVMALSTLAVEIIKEALTDEGQQFVFKSPIRKDQPLHAKAMNAALRGNHRGRKSIWELMGLNKETAFKPHDFRHTAATLLVERGFFDSEIAIALGHTFKGERVQRAAPAITQRYIHSHKLPQKRRIMEAWADELRRIINGEPADVRLAA